MTRTTVGGIIRPNASIVIVAHRATCVATKMNTLVLLVANYSTGHSMVYSYGCTTVVYRLYELVADTVVLLSKTPLEIYVYRRVASERPLCRSLGSTS